MKRSSTSGFWHITIFPQKSHFIHKSPPAFYHQWFNIQYLCFLQVDLEAMFSKSPVRSSVWLAIFQGFPRAPRGLSHLTTEERALQLLLEEGIFSGPTARWISNSHTFCFFLCKPFGNYFQTRDGTDLVARGAFRSSDARAMVLISLLKTLQHAK